MDGARSLGRKKGWNPKHRRAVGLRKRSSQLLCYKERERRNGYRCKMTDGLCD